MIDIHHHLLPGLDDGSPSMDVSLKMVEMAVADGITHIVCTPHANGRHSYDRARCENLLEDLRSRIDASALSGRITLGLGCDFHMSYDNIEDALGTPGRYAINGRKYLLIEFADTAIPESTSDSLYELSVSKQRPIITHPERNPVIQRHPERLARWIMDGALVQVTASSLTGRFGKSAQAAAEKYLSRNWVHFLASDAHNPDSRPPVMSGGYEWVKKHHGVETADRLCVANPLAVFEGRELPPQPRAIDEYGLQQEPDEEELEARARPGLFQRIFGLK
jgi:protein-tyrosine phosphatase